MKKIFKSKIDIALPILILSGMIPGFVLSLREQDWVFLGILISTLVFSAYLFLTTDYTITGKNLKVRSGFLVNKNISIEAIKSIEKTDSIWNAPAASLTDRIEIVYNQSDTIVISPKGREDFIKELLKLNPNIVVNV
ncbi:PH domain-containing protein [Flavobacterium enshiense]|uniref:Uncharacterized protein YyaB-like PH domain-containing protein n=1 Tax=Flavobacterium enshiense DK69 TaxID=1107311 RepID=A0A0A2MUE3_9FLAO|nr:PH domain-containing protein [Flavobacterium enshiense]KGO95206.1 hypothetical protein Q767_12120 [Flavobacterium enshiense DK69]